MQNYNFTLVNCDTDSITFCKPDGSSFSEEEQVNLLMELNSLYPEKIRFEHDGMFRKVIVLKAKNYIMLDQKGKIKTKGSSIKDTKRALALREMIKEIVDDLLYDKGQLLQIYNKYVTEALNVKDINRWASKKTITESVLNPKRTNEQKVLDALQGTDYQQGDKRWFFYRNDDSLCLVDKFDGKDYNVDKLLKNIHNTINIFNTVIDTDVFPNYSLKKNKKLLEKL